MARRLSLEERVEAVCREASLAKRHFEIFRVYTDPESLGRHWSTMDRYADFVRLDERAHRDLAILRVTSLFDTKEHTTHLPDLLKEARLNGASPELLSEAEKALGALADAVRKVRMIRQNAVAHRSATITYDETFKRASVTVDELGQLVGSAEAVANALARAIGIEPEPMAWAAPGDLSRLFDHLREMRQELNGPPERRRRRKW